MNEFNRIVYDVIEFVIKLWNNLLIIIFFFINIFYELFVLIFDSIKVVNKFGWIFKLLIDDVIVWIVDWYKKYVFGENIEFFI